MGWDGHRAVKASVADSAAVVAAVGCAAARAIGERNVRATGDEGPDERPKRPLRGERERAEGLQLQVLEFEF